MDSGDDSDDSDADVVETTTTPTYTRKNLKKTQGTGWNYFTSILDSSGQGLLVPPYDRRNRRQDTRPHEVWQELERCV